MGLLWDFQGQKLLFKNSFAAGADVFITIFTTTFAVSTGKTFLFWNANFRLNSLVNVLFRSEKPFLRLKTSLRSQKFHLYKENTKVGTQTRLDYKNLLPSPLPLPFAISFLYRLPIKMKAYSSTSGRFSLWFVFFSKKIIKHFPRGKTILSNQKATVLKLKLW